MNNSTPNPMTVGDIRRRYSFFDPSLVQGSYDLGDIYSNYNDDYAVGRRDWRLNEELPYLRHVKRLSNAWPHLRLLADFIEISTIPKRWNILQHKPNERNERARRTNVTRLDYFDSRVVTRQDYKTPEELDKAFTDEPIGGNGDNIKLRLFVVEDLSREVIEQLGTHLDIQPAFFRQHIVDYAWYNTRDSWVDPPNLDIIAREENWLQLRFVTARYFDEIDDFVKAREDAESFNILRRPDDDQSNKTLWDKDDSIVGITRARASFWLKPAEAPRKQAVAVLLLDPTLQCGIPLWRGYRNWERTPSQTTTPVDQEIAGPPRTSFFDDFIYWSQRPSALQSSLLNCSNSNAHIPIQALLHLVCSEWLIMASYIRTRLVQLDWEIAYPEHFLDKSNNIDIALKKLHTWRRLVPLYREMLTETLQRLFRFPCNDTNLINSRGMNGTGVDCHNTCRDSFYLSATTQEGSIAAFRADFRLALSYMEEHQDRIDRLTSVVPAIISIGDSRRGLNDNRNLARLTWLATFFIPLSFMTGLFSMQQDITELTDTIKWYFAAALPLAAISLGLVFTLTLPRVQRFRRSIKDARMTGNIKGGSSMYDFSKNRFNTKRSEAPSSRQGNSV
ncbi:hypothetical protein IQ07DRAFT_77294 [Pyrenochaeta sp. DS3sAY3a]|nr:hypothetical protein IQ07DRAFT_77294 [Pyrenochaeta sp. DS3sAY3a]